MNKKISVVIPVYNVENFIFKCLDSVLRQTYSDFEVVLIDDGSTDESGNICDMYAQKDKRFKVLHKHNEGAGQSRNVGINNVNGDYLVFLDADDYISEKYLELLSLHEEDVVFITVKQVDIEGKILKDESVTRYKNLTKDLILRQSITGNMNWGGVRKAVKTSLVKNNKIRYSTHKVGEEAVYTYQILKAATNIGFIDYPCYYYVQHSDSLSHIKINNYPLQSVAMQLEDHVKRTGAWAEYGNTVNGLHLFSLAVTADRLSLNYSYSDFKRLIRECYSSLLKNLDFSVGIDFKNMNPKAVLLYYLLKVHAYMLVWFLCRIKNLK